MSAPAKRAAPKRKSRENQLDELQTQAAAGARAGVEYLRELLEYNTRELRAAEALRAELDRLEGVGWEAGAVTLQNVPPAEKEALGRLERALARHKPASDSAAASCLRALEAITAQASQLLEGGRQAGTVQVMWDEEAKELME